MFLLLVVLAGLLGTVFMSLVMWFIHEQGWANADMIRAVGSLVTRRYEGSVPPGLLMHLTAGCLFAIPYILIIRSLGSTNIFVILMVGAAIGAFHGAAMVFVLMALAEKHPLPQFQTAGPAVGWAHVVGHVAYGVGVAVMVAWLGTRLGVVTHTIMTGS
ncbi:MAG TPA: hypothetical protein VFH88_02800 [Candidatus Krumholzibacteria bacterium]|nr:hypothetical protein [Candidatus Krumholzibacteria bacterium]